jgi:hypothetical protein
MGPPPVRPRASLSITDGCFHACVPSTSSMLSRPGPSCRRPTSTSGAELLCPAKLVVAVMKAPTASHVDRSTSKQGLLDFGSDEKNTMRPSPCLTGSVSAAPKPRSMHPFHRHDMKSLLLVRFLLSFFSFAVEARRPRSFTATAEHRRTVLTCFPDHALVAFAFLLTALLSFDRSPALPQRGSVKSRWARYCHWWH